MPGTRYVAFVDSAGGTGSDSFTLAIAHRDRDGAAVLDLLRERKPRFVPAQVIAEYVDVLRLYGVHEVQSDAFAGGFHSSEWLRHGIRFVACERTTSENYLSVLPDFLAGRCRLIDNPGHCVPSSPHWNAASVPATGKACHIQRTPPPMTISPRPPLERWSPSHSGAASCPRPRSKL
jgi:hypothetical protein